MADSQSLLGQVISHMRHAGVGHFGLAAFVVLFAVGASSAQVVSGSISGSVLDATGAVIPSAQLKSTNTATGAVSRTVSDGAGLFRFAELHIGDYTV